jgi:hypothetical protein
MSAIRLRMNQLNRELMGFVDMQRYPEADASPGKRSYEKRELKQNQGWANGEEAS